MPKDKGGLGIKQVAMINAVYMAKLVWICSSNQEFLWAKVLSFKYVKDKSTDTSLSRSCTLSPLWRGMLTIAVEARDTMGWLLGNRKSVTF